MTGAADSINGGQDENNAFSARACGQHEGASNGAALRCRRPVYCGAKQYGLRAQAGNFDEKQLEQAVTLAHAAGAQVNLTLNIFAFDGDLDGMVRTAKAARDMGVDAAIISDLGAIGADCAGGAGTGYSRKHTGEHDEQRIPRGYTRRWGRSASCWRGR